MFLDIGVGILLSIAFSKIFGVFLSAKLIAGGIAFSLVPDLDVFVELKKRGRVGGRVQGHHRELTHFPLTYILAALLIYFYAGGAWACLFFLAALFHFLHDSIGMGWGIKWWWPFSNKSYKLFSEKDGRLFSKNFIVCWEPEELKKVIYRYGDDHWFKNFYMRLHPVAIFEFLFFIISIIALLRYVG